MVGGKKIADMNGNHFESNHHLGGTFQKIFIEYFLISCWNPLLEIEDLENGFSQRAVLFSYLI
jgi:hypothetical protein|tara:strand:- start:34 stop:222 length:189 start_codon:yes stop_codon:yes gene_type:complete